MPIDEITLNASWQLFKGGCISFVAQNHRKLAFAIRDRISPGNNRKSYIAVKRVD